jgi:hypothetical protein
MVVLWSKVLVTMDDKIVTSLPMTRMAFSNLQGVDTQRIVILIEAKNASSDFFVLCLKMMEDPNFRGCLWFWGRPIADYPAVIRSRSFVRYYAQGEAEQEVVDSTANRYAKLRDLKASFVNLLFYLDVPKKALKEHFGIIWRLIEAVTPAAVELFREWMEENGEIFTQKELSLCYRFRENAFKSVYRENNFADPKALLLFCLGYLVVA